MRLVSSHWSAEVNNHCTLTDGNECRVSKRFPFPQMKRNPFHSGAYTFLQTKSLLAA